MKLKELTKAEEQVMQVLWKIEKGFAKEIIENIEYSDKKPAYNTILTILRILVDKGFVKYKVYGKSFEYYPTCSKDEYSRFSLNSIMSKYFQNSPKSMMSFFVKDQGIDLEELQQFLDEAKEASPTDKKKK